MPGRKTAIALSLGLAVVVYSILFFDGSQRTYRLWYYAPAAVVAGAFCVDRFQIGWTGRLPLLLDLFIAICCLMRPIFSFPPVSGHAVFSIYVILTCRPWSTRGLGAALLSITLYAKLVLWKGDPTLIPGLLVGLFAGALYQSLIFKFRRNDRTVRNLPL